MSDLSDKLSHELVVSEKIQETPDAYSFRLAIPKQLEEKFKYRAGQFVTLFLNVNGEDLRRSYSLCTSPEYDGTFQITVKQVEGGRGSNHLALKIQQGDILKVSPPQGTFFQPLETNKGAEYFLFSAGSGITPTFSILKEVLSSDTSARVFLFFANRDEDHIIYKSELSNLEEKFGDQLVITHRLTKPKSQETATYGRCNPGMIKNFVEIHRQQSVSPKQAYICGPEGFMSSVSEGLKNYGFDEKEIRTESFKSVTSVPSSESAEEPEDVDGVIIGDPAAASSSSPKIVALINGEQIEIDADPELSVLENLINNGKNPPYSCMDGACMACMAKVTAGKVIQDDFGILTEENVEDREALTCQARPLSATVNIDYDDL